MPAQLVVANWKMYKTLAEVQDFFEELLPKVKGLKNEIVVCPPAIFIPEAYKLVQGSNVKIGAQNVHFELQGPFTGEISLAMVKEFCEYVIVGHSERRSLETNEDINKKLCLILGRSCRPILCIGERLEQREFGEANKVVEQQLFSATSGIAEDKIENLSVAYEPVWAIGTGINATAAQAEEMHKVIRSLLAKRFGGKAKAVRILYGGSVTPENAAELSQIQELDGFLVGGASLNSKAFAAIVKAGQ
jgi:triosephosphate isomerase